jgi:hypothetical protein
MSCPSSSGDFRIPTFKTDPGRWNKGWEKTLPLLSAAKYVYPKLGEQAYQKVDWNRAKISRHRTELRGRVCTLRENFVKLWSRMPNNNKQFITAWQLLKEKERKRHLLKGLEEAIAHGKFRQDTRAMCPELTITTMLKEQECAFPAFLDTYRNTKRELGSGKMYTLPNEWWNKEGA